MRSIPMLCVIGLACGACMDDASAPPQAPGGFEAVVYEPGPHVAQCEPPVTTPAQSAAKLVAAGIEVRRSSCGVLVGVMFPAVCGGGTGEIILHDIPAGRLPAAEALGFGSVETLDDWARADCAQYIHAIELAQASTSCTDIRNRVVSIRNLAQPGWGVVLLDQAGNCADAAYQQRLFGEDGTKLLCSNADSIAGPRKSCAVPEHAALFDTILANLEAPDLGLGSGYSVGEVYPAD